MEPVRSFSPTLSQRNELRAFIRSLIAKEKYLVFRLEPDADKSMGYSIEYTGAEADAYLAISHSWTDRTGRGDAISVDDLAPWPVQMSPAKGKMLSWLFSLQTKARVEGAEAWFWLDLFCIDQSREDEKLFATQLQQISGVFGNANGCLALLASWPCTDAQQMSFPETAAANTDPHYRWGLLTKWVERHHLVCRCTPMVDAWLTRVWTRQELLYSNRIALYTAPEWLAEDHETFKDCWEEKSVSYDDIDPSEGLHEFAGCFVTWAEKYRRTYSASEIAEVAIALIKGQFVSQVPADLSPSVVSGSTIQEWFALNWAMISNRSIRRTTNARDAILSQMLLLPGYITPPLPRVMKLEELAADAIVQFRRLVPSYQLIPLDLRVWKPGDIPELEPAMNRTSDQPYLIDILQSAGAPCKMFPKAAAPPNGFDQRWYESDASILAYRPDTLPSFEVIKELDLTKDPHAAMEVFLELREIWNILERATLVENVRKRLKDLEPVHKQCGTAENTDNLSKALETMVLLMLNLAEPGVLPHSNDDISWVRTLPPLRAARITYKSDQSPSHINVLFGDLPVGTKGTIWGLGIDKVTKCERGIAGELDGQGVVQMQAFGAILPVVPANRGREVSERKFYAVRPVDVLIN